MPTISKIIPKIRTTSAQTKIQKRYNLTAKLRAIFKDEMKSVNIINNPQLTKDVKQFISLMNKLHETVKHSKLIFK